MFNPPFPIRDGSTVETICGFNDFDLDLSSNKQIGLLRSLPRSSLTLAVLLKFGGDSRVREKAL